MNARNAMCMTCHYQKQDNKIRALIRINELLYRLRLDTHNVQRPIYFNWGTPTKCNIGISCDKTRENERYFNQYSRENTRLLTAFIEQKPDDRIYHEILRYMQGNFPTAYRQLEQEYNTRGNN